MAKRKTPKVKKEKQQKVNPQKAREDYMSKMAEDVRKLRDSIVKEDKELGIKLDLYAVLYKNLLLEHYKTLNIHYKDDEETENKKQSVILDKDGKPAKK